MENITIAFEEAKEKGYGVATLNMTDKIEFSEPVIVKHGSKHGVKIKAKTNVYHIIKTEIETEISQIVGNEKQTEDLITLINENSNELYNLDVFGKTLGEIAKTGIENKLYRLPEQAQCKIQETLARLINEGNGGLICIIL